MRKKGYFVSYTYSGDGKGFGNGRCYTSYKIKSYDDIEKTEVLILKSNPQLKGCKILIQYYSTKKIKV